MRAVVVASALALSAAFEAAKPAKPTWGKMGNWTKPAAVPWASIKTTQVTSGNGTNLFWFQNVLSDALSGGQVGGAPRHRLGTVGAVPRVCPGGQPTALLVLVQVVRVPQGGRQGHTWCNPTPCTT